MPIRSFIVTSAERGLPLALLLHKRMRLSASEVQRLLADQRIWCDGRACGDGGRRLSAGQRVEVRPPRRLSVPIAVARPLIRFVDSQLVVVDKPAGLTTVRHAREIKEFGRRARRYLPPTLADLLPSLITLPPGQRPRAVHRLDKDTSGLLVFALTPRAEQHLGQQFRAHSVERRYLAVVRGRAVAGRLESCLVRDRGDGRRGSSRESAVGQRAVTHVRILEELGEYTLVECRLETGRTHQVRIHLGEAGTPLCGERIYDRPLHGRPYPDGSGAPRLALHAALLGLQHPLTGRPMRWESPLPPDLRRLVTRLRRRHRASASRQEQAEQPRQGQTAQDD